MRLIDADANIETMKKCAENPEDKYALLCYRYAKMVLEEAPTVEPVPPWHRVEERPKEEKREYLICTDTGYMCSCRWTNNVYGLGESERWGWCIADVPQFQKVVYWMPIEPPKEKKI